MKPDNFIVHLKLFLAISLASYTMYPKKDCKNLPLVDDLIIIKKWMNKNIQLWMIIVLDLCIHI